MERIINFIAGLSIIVIFGGSMIGIWVMGNNVPIFVRIVISAVLVLISCLVAKNAIDY